MLNKVAVIKNIDIKKAVRQAVEQVGFPKVKGKRVLVKPNCNSPDEYPGTTNPQVVAEVVRLCEEGGAKEIIVGDKSSVFWPHCSTKKVMKVIGLLEALKNTKAKILPFDKNEWVKVKPDNEVNNETSGIEAKAKTHWPRGFKIPKALVEAEVIISVPVIHTHSITGISLSLKNSVGILDGKSRVLMHASRHIQEKVAEINLTYEVDLVILDGTKAFIDGGPNRGEEVRPNTIVASRSRVQADIAAYKLLVEWGAELPEPAESHPQIKHAIKVGVK
ncbi:DUF362 domain-containing protein [Patescibacteria group bacterium]